MTVANLWKYSGIKNVLVAHHLLLTFFTYCLCLSFPVPIVTEQMPLFFFSFYNIFCGLF
uniref:Uncharacterized protein n=1 Tax=Rhizophora mucronata TaxID=61149 RepID=A0A2P2MZB7_RHIMU